MRSKFLSIFLAALLLFGSLPAGSRNGRMCRIPLEAHIPSKQETLFAGSLFRFRKGVKQRKRAESASFRIVVFFTRKMLSDFTEFPQIRLTIVSLIMLK